MTRVKASGGICYDDQSDDVCLQRKQEVRSPNAPSLFCCCAQMESEWKRFVILMVREHGQQSHVRLSEWAVLVGSNTSACGKQSRFKARWAPHPPPLLQRSRFHCAATTPKSINISMNKCRGGKQNHVFFIKGEEAWSSNSNTETKRNNYKHSRPR